jgi:hypothetical protein
VSAFDFEPKISAGTMSTIPGKAARGRVVDLVRWVREAWPDLPEGSEIAMLPQEDLAVLVEATRGRRVLAIRHIMTFSISPAAQSTPRRSLLARLLAEPVVAYLLGVAIATAFLWGHR